MVGGKIKHEEIYKITWKNHFQLLLPLFRFSLILFVVMSFYSGNIVFLGDLFLPYFVFQVILICVVLILHANYLDINGGMELIIDHKQKRIKVLKDLYKIDFEISQIERIEVVGDYKNTNIILPTSRYMYSKIFVIGFEQPVVVTSLLVRKLEYLVKVDTSYVFSYYAYIS